MLEETYQKINDLKKKDLVTLLLVGLVNMVFIGYLIYRNVTDQGVLIFVLLYIGLVILSLFYIIVLFIRDSKKANKIIYDELLPYIIRRVNSECELTEEVFIKEEVLKCLFVSRYGSFKSQNIVQGMSNNINYRFSYLLNIISSGQSSYDVFSGTYITLPLRHRFNGYVQLRDKGKAEKNKKLDLIGHRYEGEMSNRYKDIRMFTNDDYLAQLLITDALIRFYHEIKEGYKKGIYLTIIHDELMIGIHDRKNLFSFRFFKKIKPEILYKRVEEFEKIIRIVEKTSKFISEEINRNGIM